MQRLFICSTLFVIACGSQTYEPRTPTTTSTPSPTPAPSTTTTTPTASTPAASSCDVTGGYAALEEHASDGEEYSTEVHLTRSGSSVSGWFSGWNGAIGTIDGTLSGCTVTGQWHVSGGSGPYRFVFSGEKFTGGWDYSGVTASPKYSWSGTRTSKTPEPKPSSSGGSSNSSGCHSNSDCGHCQRCELSTGSCLSKVSC